MQVVQVPGGCGVQLYTRDRRVSLHSPSLEFSRDQARTWCVSSPFPWLACIKIVVGVVRVVAK